MLSPSFAAGASPRVQSLQNGDLGSNVDLRSPGASDDESSDEDRASSELDEAVTTITGCMRQSTPSHTTLDIDLNEALNRGLDADPYVIDGLNVKLNGVEDTVEQNTLKAAADDVIMVIAACVRTKVCLAPQFVPFGCLLSALSVMCDRD